MILRGLYHICTYHIWKRDIYKVPTQTYEGLADTGPCDATVIDTQCDMNLGHQQIFLLQYHIWKSDIYKVPTQTYEGLADVYEYRVTWTHINVSCHTYARVMAHIWMSHGTHINGSSHTYERVMSHRDTRSNGIGIPEVTTIMCELHMNVSHILIHLLIHISHIGIPEVTA